MLWGVDLPEVKPGIFRQRIRPKVGHIVRDQFASLAAGKFDKAAKRRRIAGLSSLTEGRKNPSKSGTYCLVRDAVRRAARSVAEFP